MEMKKININKRAPQRGAFLFICICISILFWNCKDGDENDNTIKNFAVKKPEDVTKTTLSSYK